MKIFIEPKYVAAAVQCMGKTDIRDWVNGALIETGPQGAFLVTTDGHALFAHHIGAECMPSAHVVVPRALIDKITPTAKGLVAITVTDNEKSEHNRKGLRTVTVNDKTAFEVAGGYRDWRGVVPARTTGQLGYFQPGDLAAVYAARDAINRGTKPPFKSRSDLSHNGTDSPGLMVIDSRAFAIVMPTRGTNEQVCVPAWIAAVPAAEPDAVAA